MILLAVTYYCCHTCANKFINCANVFFSVVVISHLPVLPLNGRFAERVMTDINPDIIFSGHDHHGSLYSGSRTSLKTDREMSLFSKRDDVSPFKVETKTKNSGLSFFTFDCGVNQ